MSKNEEKKLVRNCRFGEEYPTMPWGKTIIGCTEDSIWCNDCIAEKCEMYADKNEADD